MRKRYAVIFVLGFVAPVLAVSACGGTSVMHDAAVDSGASSPADALWRLISQCINVEGEQNCQCAALLATCCDDANGSYADAVWDENDDYVTIRDLKQCGCPGDFVHGLALPRVRITGIEDPDRPDGIWPYAWDHAVARIPDQQEIGLAINPPQARSQNQLHIHIVRLAMQTRTWFDDPAAQQQAAEANGLVFMALPDLNSVFTSVEAQVGEQQIGSTGLLVAQASNGQYEALLTNKTSTEAYTQSLCH